MTHALLNDRADSKKPYGNVTYADPGYQSDGVKRYPIDTAAHAKAAWSYINQKGNASKYSSDDLAKVKARIRAACKKFGIEISDDSMNMKSLVQDLLDRASLAMPPADVHEDAIHAADISFLHNMASQLRGSEASARAHVGVHPDVAGLAATIAASHGQQLARVGKLQQRLGVVSATATSSGTSSGTSGHGNSGQGGGRSRSQLRFAAGEMFVRAFNFESRSTGDGRTLEGYAAVFNKPTRIQDRRGDFDEVILPGAFRRSLEQRTPVLQFEHGRDPRVGAVPIGAIQDIREDSTGLFVRAHLYDNQTVEPVRQAIAGGSIKGMSFRFAVPDGGDKWTQRSGEVELREIHDTDTAECGPVVFPAYDQTSVSVRSLLAQLDPDGHRALLRELAGELAEELRDLTGRPDARSAGGGDETGSRPGNGQAPANHRQRLDDGALRARGIK